MEVVEVNTEVLEPRTELVEVSTEVVKASMDVSSGNFRGSAVNVAAEVPWPRPCTSAEAAGVEASMEAVEASRGSMKCCWKYSQNDGSAQKSMGVNK